METFSSSLIPKYIRLCKSKAKHLCFGVIKVWVFFICNYFFKKSPKNYTTTNSTNKTKCTPKNSPHIFQLTTKFNLIYMELKKLLRDYTSTDAYGRC